MTLRGWWHEYQGKGPEKGVYKYDGRGELKNHRFHLRIDSERKGVLLVDAANLVFLNGTAVDYVHLVLEDRREEKAAKYMMRRYRNLDRERAIKHYRETRALLLAFVRGGAEVLNVIGSEKGAIGADDFGAPYRMDLILTYRCQNRCGHCYNEPREVKELALEQWKEVIGIVWGLGVPHIVFTGGEPTLYPGLDELVAKSEEYGQVTGLVTNGRRLREPGYLADLVRKGLDHVQVTVLSHRASLHDELVGEKGAWMETIEGLKAALREDLYVSTNTTIMRSNLEDVEETMRFLVSLGVKHVAFNGLIRSGRGKVAEGIGYDELCTTMRQLKRIAEQSDVKLIWYTPTPYCKFNPVNEGLGIKQCTACALNMAIEPDGSVLPCQSYYAPLGNILTDKWDTIWNHALCKRIRNREYLDEECAECGLMEACGGGCPLSRDRPDYICLDRHSSM